MNPKIALAFFLLTATFSYAQYDWTEGRIVLKNGDTITGQIELPMVSKDLITFGGSEKVKYRKDHKSEKIKYDETQVSQIIFKRSDTEIAYFEYVPVSDKHKGIFKVITRGKATLYGRMVSVTSSGYRNGIGVGFGSPVSNNVPGGIWMYNSNDLDEFYVLRPNETVAEPLVTARISRSFKKRAMDYFSDCPALVAKLEEGMYKNTNAREVVEFYNNCQ